MMGNVLSADGVAKTVKSFFSRQTSVEIDIDAESAPVWALLADLEGWTRWSNTIIELRGKPALGERIQLRSSLAPERVFNLRVKTLEPGRKLVWGDALGSREYTLTANSMGERDFEWWRKSAGQYFHCSPSLSPHSMIHSPNLHMI